MEPTIDCESLERELLELMMKNQDLNARAMMTESKIDSLDKRLEIAYLKKEILMKEIGNHAVPHITTTTERKLQVSLVLLSALQNSTINHESTNSHDLTSQTQEDTLETVSDDPKLRKKKHIIEKRLRSMNQANLINEEQKTSREVRSIQTRAASNRKRVKRAIDRRYKEGFTKYLNALEKREKRVGLCFTNRTSQTS